MLIFKRFIQTSRVLRQVADSPLLEYERLVSLGKIRSDPYQRGIISNLSSLHQHLKTYTPPDPAKIKSSSGGFNFFGLFGGSKSAGEDEQTYSAEDYKSIPQGIYLYGDVGCGKTMLMDLFYSTIPPHLTKRRLHFHQFMQNLHKRSHQLIQQHGQDFNTIPVLAQEIASESTVLCFDEFQVTDVADAMLLRRLLTTALNPHHGLVLFTTSNRAPDELYMNGIQRQSFIPCIKLLEQRTKVVYLNSPTDYRKVPKPISSVYYSPPKGMLFKSPQSQELAQKHIDNWYAFFSQGHVAESDLKLKIWGRELNVPKSSPPYVAQFTFDQLCGSPLSAADYLSIASAYNSVIVTDIPYLSVQNRDKIRRFITFLDAIYDNYGRLCVTAVDPFSKLFVEPEDMINEYELKIRANVNSSEVKEDVHGVDDDDELVKTHGFEKHAVQKSSKMFQLDEERFAFARALSRLSQMSTQDWVDSKGPTSK
ncbi:hypothetical protein WICPIJ_003461 [Wickerhamomyces pijperi]|uniref:AAA+ ATPase domain-containing protein n=1 Tax=Wickerhamomyces pijperi TaxID=599730 RepID=A0A9P8Q9J0_WICPI|nr:hypothetical protein WICPIJ_003461 [Wickerhamomyces pijperi]